MPESGQLSQLLDGQPTGRTGRWAMTERPRASLAGPSHPLADGRCADPQRLRDLALGPPLLLEVPGLQALGFFPVLRCRLHP
jgi:hypothetical protein